MIETLKKLDDITSGIKKKSLNKYLSYLKTEIIFKYYALLDYKKEDSFYEENVKVCQKYASLLKINPDEKNLIKIFDESKDDIKKYINEYFIYNCYKMEVTVLKECYLSNFNEIAIYSQINRKETVIKDIVGYVREKNVNKKNKNLSDFFDYVNLIIPISYTKAKFREVLTNTITNDLIMIDYDNYFLNDLLAYVNPMYIIDDKRLPDIDIEIANIREAIEQEKEGLNKNYFNNIWTELDDKQMYIDDLVGFIMAVNDYLFLQKEHDENLVDILDNILDMSDEEFDIISEENYSLFQEVNNDSSLFEAQEKLEEVKMLFVKFAPDHNMELLEEKFRDVKLIIDDNVSDNEFIDSLIKYCIEAEKNKKIRRTRMKVLLSEFPLPHYDINTLLNNVDYAFETASNKQLNWFLDRLYKEIRVK